MSASKSGGTEIIKKTLQYGIKKGIEVVEKPARAAGRETGWDVAIARTARRLLGQKK